MFTLIHYEILRRWSKMTGHFGQAGQYVVVASNKTTGHIALTTLLVFALSLPVARPAAAAEITFTTSNDPVSGNERADDLYTAEVALEVGLNRRDLAFRERMFTDHERGVRFDETSLEVSRPVTRLGGWGGEAGVGVLHVGRGLLGQGAQNTVHRLVGSDLEDLDYAADHRFYPLAKVVLARPLNVSSNLGAVITRVEAVAAPGFHNSLRVGLETERAMGAGFGLLVGVAGVLHDVESDLLGDVVASSGVAWDLGVGWRNVSLILSHNAYGTETRHVTLGYRFDVGTLGRLGAAH